MPVYTVRRGDCISSIAFQFGLFPDTIWDHPQNENLKKKRRNPNVLFEGDAVFVPEKRLREEPAATDQLHSYKRKGVPEKLKIKFLRNGKPIANKRYVLDVDGKTSEGATDEDGNVEIAIEPDAKSGKVTFPDFDEEYPLDLGHLDPVEEVSGVQARLKNLGFLSGQPSGRLDDPTKKAVAAFQDSCGLPSNGEIDAATRDALKSAFGS